MPYRARPGMRRLRALHETRGVEKQRQEEPGRGEILAERLATPAGLGSAARRSDDGRPGSAGEPPASSRGSLAAATEEGILYRRRV